VVAQLREDLKMRSKILVAAGIVAVNAGIWAFTLRTEAAGKLSTQDYLDIQQVYATYCHAIDHSEWDRLRSIFVPTGGLNNGTVDSLVESAKGQVARTKGGGRHWMGNLIITPTPEGARGEAYMFVLETASQPPNIRPTGVYVDTLVKTRDGWKFNRRTLKNDNRPQQPS
jgi:hypothetical protein